MRALKTYWDSLVSSLSNPDYYFLLLKTKFQSSVFFFLITLALISGLTALWVKASVWQGMVQSIEGTGMELLGDIPSDTRFEYENGSLRIDQTLPLYIESPKNLKDADFPRFFLAMNSKEEALESFLTLSPTTVYLRSQGQVDSLKYAEFVPEESGAFTRTDLENTFQKGVQFLQRNSWQIISLLSVVWFASKIVSGLLLIALYTFIIQSLGWIMGVRLTYKQMFRWGLHIYPIAIGADFLSSIITRGTSIPLITLIYLAFSLVILWRGRSVQRTIHPV